MFSHLYAYASVDRDNVDTNKESHFHDNEQTDMKPGRWKSDLIAGGYRSFSMPYVEPEQGQSTFISVWQKCIELNWNESLREKFPCNEGLPAITEGART